MTGWQDIKTAPLDERVILWCEEGRYRANVASHHFGRVSAYDDGERFVVADGLHGNWTLTHWMPLPEPPEATK